MNAPPTTSMHPARRRAPISRLVTAAFVCLAIATSCEDSQSPPQTPTSDESLRGRYDPIAGGIEFELRSPDGSTTSLRLVASNPRYDATTQELTADVVVRNVGAELVWGPPRVILSYFDPPTVKPRNAISLACQDCGDCVCWPWAYDYSGTFGADDTLEPGESSSPIEWVLFVPGRVGFSFRTLFTPQRGPQPGVIAGHVFADANGDGRLNPGDSGIVGATVHLHHADATTSAVTDENARFTFSVTEAGLYQVEREAANDCEPTTPLSRQVVIVERPDGTLSGYDRADFGCARDGQGGPIPVRGVVFDDLDLDGERDRWERGILGVRIEGSAPQCSTLAPIITYTGPGGEYSLVLPACDPPFVIHRGEVRRFVGTTANPVVFEGGMPTEQPPPPPRPLIANFGVAFADSDTTRPAAIEGWVYWDTNGNGRRDRGETGIADIHVAVGGLSCEVPGVGTVTHANGFYRIEGHWILCSMPWRVFRGPIASGCTPTPNPVELHPPAPEDRIYRVDFGIDACPPRSGITAVVR